MRETLSIMLAGTFLGAASAWAGPLPTGAWLVDLGRDYPRTPQSGVSDADAEITLLYMQAAGRVDPALAEARLWQYDMLVALNRPDAAREALASYVRLAPADIAAHLTWVSLEIERLQTAESRADFCTRHLATPGLPGKVASDLHRRLAEFHWSRGERDQALSAANAALDAYELNFVARQLLEQIQPPQEPSRTAELDGLLLALSAGPNDPYLARAAADELMRLNLPEPAARLYAHAAKVLQLFDPHGDLAQALADHATALYADGRESEAREQIEASARQWKLLLERHAGDLDPALTAQMAWFFAFHEPQAGEAERLARLARTQEPDLIVARRALGSALRQLNRLDEARTELSDIAGQDVAAAAELVLALSAAGDKEQAAQVLGRAATQPADPDGYLALARAADRAGVAPPAREPIPAEAARTAKAFPWQVLDYPLHPDKYVSLKLDVPRKELPPGEPWLLTVRLRNTGPFPITVGPGMMLLPDLLVGVETRGDRPRTTGPTLRFSLDRTPRLMPGESVEVTHTIDLGVIRSGMIGTPQMAHEVTVNAVLSPISFIDEQGQEIIAPAVGGLLAPPLEFRRLSFEPTADNLRELVAGLQSAEVMDRIRSLEVLTMLLAEHQHLRSGTLKYEARPIDAPGIQALILGMAKDADWQVRARLAECLRWIGLDAAGRSTGNDLLNDAHWLVRGLAMRVFADHYRAKAQPVLSQAAAEDSDEWVRRLAAALGARIALIEAP